MNKTTIVQEIKREIQECVHLNKDDEVAAAIVWDTVKAVMSRSLTSRTSYIKNEGLKYDNLQKQLRELERQHQTDHSEGL